MKTVLIAGLFLAAMSTSAFACNTNQVKCIPNPVPSVNFKGKGQVKNLVPVLVCHPWWDQLWGDPAKGERWWGPTTRYKNWQADLKPVKQQCKWFWIKEGGYLETDVSCLDGETVTTGIITASMARSQVNLMRKR
jgi:hypothetical protein